MVLSGLGGPEKEVMPFILFAVWKNPNNYGQKQP
jgi:hypothetical protein